MPLDSMSQETDLLTLESLVAWAEKRDPAEIYEWSNADICLLAQYAKEHNLNYMDVSDIELPKSSGFNETVEGLAFKYPHTFGDFVARARSVMDG